MAEPLTPTETIDRLVSIIPKTSIPPVAAIAGMLMADTGLCSHLITTVCTRLAADAEVPPAT